MKRTNPTMKERERQVPSSRAFPSVSTGSGSKMFIEFATRSSIRDMLSIRMLLFLSSTRGTYSFLPPAFGHYIVLINKFAILKI
jgi:hypothetical protein